MTSYSATELERAFKKVARIRHGKQYSNDASYWTGGRCNWGGSHNLSEDCQTFANGFNKIEGLREIKEELKKCTSKSEYDAKKNNYIRQCEEALNGLNNNTSSSYMFGVCCIWSDAAPKKTVESKMKVIQQGLQNTKSALQKEDYKWVQELKELELEINQINKQMEENKRKAMKETDPMKKAALIAQIEEDGLLLQQKYQKKKEISDKFKWDPKKKVDDLIEAMKKAINKTRKKKDPSGSGGGSHRNPNPSDTDSSDSEDDYNSDNDNNNTSGGSKKDKNSNFFQNNQQLLIILGLATLVIFYLLNQKQEKEPNYYDF